MLTLSEGSPQPKKRRFMVANFLLPMALNVSNEDVSLEKEAVDLQEEHVRFLSQNERCANDPGVGERDCLLVGKVQRHGSNGKAVTPLAWEKHAVKQEIVMAQTVICVEAIKLVEEEFSSILQSQAVSSKYREISLQLTAVMRRSSGELNHSLADENLWSTIPFSVFCYGISRLMSLACVDNQDLSLVKNIILAAQSLTIDVINQALDDLVVTSERSGVPIDELTLRHVGDLVATSERSGVPVDELTLRHVTYMRREENFEKTVLQWAEFATKKQDRNMYSHPWLLLPQAQRKIWMRDLEKTLEDDFSLNFRSVGYIAKLALRTQEMQENAKSLKQTENLQSEYLHLLRASRKEVEEGLLKRNAKKLADDEAMEDGQFHNMFLE